MIRAKNLGKLEVIADRWDVRSKDSLKRILNYVQSVLIAFRKG